MTDRRPAEDLWHLSIDDLFATPAETPRLGGPGPFVINLSTSTAPIGAPPKGTFSFEGLHVYQITRTEDGRQRFRLRLGPVKTELEADTILAAVREHYPGAMTAVAADDDLRAITVASHAAEKAKPAKPAAPPRRPLPKPTAKPAPDLDDLEDTHPGWNLDALLPHLNPARSAGAAKPASVKRTVAAPAPKTAPARTVATPAPKPAAAPPAPAPAPPARPAHPERRVAARRASTPVRAPAPSAPPPRAAAPKPAPPVAKAPPPPVIPVLTEPVAPVPANQAARLEVAIPPASPPPAAATAPPPVLDHPVVPPVAAVPPPVVDERPAAVEPPAAVAPPVTVERRFAAERRNAVEPHIAVGEPAAPPVAAATPPESVEPPAATPVPVTAEKDETQRTLLDKISAIVEVFDGEPKSRPRAGSAVSRPEPEVAPAPVPVPVPVAEARPARAAMSAPAAVAGTRAAPATPPAVGAPLASIEELIAREIRAAADIPSAATRRTKLASDALETDWISILSHPVDGTDPVLPGARRDTPPQAPADQAPVQATTPTEPEIREPAPVSPLAVAPASVEAVTGEPAVVAPVAITPVAVGPVAEPVAVAPTPVPVLRAPVVPVVEVSAPAPDTEPPAAPALANAGSKPPAAAADDLIVIDEDNGLEKLVAKNNALVESLDVRAEPSLRSSLEAAPAEAPAADSEPPAAPSSPPLPSTPASAEESIARKLQLLAELLPALERPEPAASEPAGAAAKAIEQLRDEAYVDTIIDPTGSEWDAILDISVEESTATTAGAAPAPAPAPQPEAAPAAPAQASAAAAVEAVARVPEPVSPAPASEPVNPPVASEAAVGPAVQIERAAEISPAPIVAINVDPMPKSRPEPVQPPAAGADTSLERLVARNNAMIDSLEARTAAGEAPPATDAAPVAAAPQAAPALAVPDSAPLVLEVIHGPPRVLDVPLLAAPAKVAESPAPRNVTAPAKKPVHAKAAARHVKHAKMRKPNPWPEATEAPAAPPLNGAPATPALPDHMVTQPLALTPKPVPPAPKPGSHPAPMVAAKAPAAPTHKPHQQSPQTPRHKPPQQSAQTPHHKPHQQPAQKPPHHGGPRKVEILAEPLPAVDSTQTIRSLTPLELADDKKSRWFAIQLSLAEEAFDPEHVPHLDIFDEFRLYCVAGLDQGKFMHALRLGFFESEASAQAVAGYLGCYFESPAVKRVSNAERERFAEQQMVVPRKDVGATGLHSVIELASPRQAPETTLAELRESIGERAPEDRSLWSRLFSPLKR